MWRILYKKWKSIDPLYLIELGNAFCVACISLVIARLLKPEEQAEWALYNNFLNFGVTVLLVGLPTSVLIKWRRNEIAGYRSLNSLLMYSVIISVTFVISFYFFAKIFDFSKLSSDLYKLRAGYFILGAHLFINLSTNFLSIWLDYNKSVRELSLIRLFSNILFLVLLLASQYKVLPWDIHLGMLWSIYVLWIGLVSLYFYIRSIGFKRKEADGMATINISETIFSMGWIYLAITIFQWLNYRLDLWFVSWMTDKTSTGVYSIAAGMSMYLLLIPRNNQRLLLNQFNDSTAHNISITLQEVRKLAGILFVFSIVSILGSYMVFKFYLGPVYFQGLYLFIILVAGMYFVAITMPISALFNYLKLPGTNLKAALAGMLSNVLLNYFWIPKYGLFGAAFASFFSYILISFSLYTSFYKLQSMHVK